MHSNIKALGSSCIFIGRIISAHTGRIIEGKGMGLKPTLIISNHVKLSL